MKTPNVMMKRMILDSSSPPVPYGGRRRRERSPRTVDYRPTVKLVTGRVPSDEGSNLKPLVTVGSSEPELISRSRRVDWILGTVLGGVGMLCVLNFWVAVTIGVINDAVGLSIPYWTHYSFPLALYGCHFFGIPGSSLAKDGFQLGTVAIVSFWGSLLIGIPISVVVNLLGG